MVVVATAGDCFDLANPSMGRSTVFPALWNMALRLSPGGVFLSEILQTSCSKQWITLSATFRRKEEAMYVGMVTFPVLPGKLDEAIELWKTVSVPEAESQPGFLRAMLWRDDARNTLVGIGIWRSKADSDAFAATGPWRPGSHQHQQFAALCGADPERQEFDMVVDIEP